LQSQSCSRSSTEACSDQRAPQRTASACSVCKGSTRSPMQMAANRSPPSCEKVPREKFVIGFSQERLARRWPPGALLALAHTVAQDADARHLQFHHIARAEAAAELERR